MSMSTVRELLASEEYQAAASHIQLSLRLNSTTEVSMNVLDFEGRRIAAAGYDLPALQQSLGDMPRLEHYVRAKLRKYLSVATEQEYPVGEEPEEGDEDEVLGTPRFPSCFLVGHLLEFTLMSQGGDLLGFLTATRMPKASRYAKEIRALFAELP